MLIITVVLTIQYYYIGMYCAAGRLYCIIMNCPSGVGGLDGDGDVFNPENQEEFRKFVMENTNNKGIHFGMADGVSFGQIMLHAICNAKLMQSKLLNYFSMFI